MTIPIKGSPADLAAKAKYAKVEALIKHKKNKSKAGTTIKNSFTLLQQFENTYPRQEHGEFGPGPGGDKSNEKQTAISVFGKLPKPGPVRDALEHSLSAITQVHSLPSNIQGIPEAYALRSNSKDLGLYTSIGAPGGTERPMKLGLANPENQSPETAFGSGTLAVAHEFGHYLDSVAGLAGGSMRATLTHASTPEWETLYQAIIKSPTRVALKTSSTSGSQKEYASYLSSPVETFARAYSQYIAVRSQDSKMLSDVRLARSSNNPLVRDSQWPDDEFEPIAKAFDVLFSSMHLLKKG